ncbi:MAG TPA: hypothetical protein VIK74_11480 [Parasegetibacter sp.]|jgi:hypothetical protein
MSKYVEFVKEERSAGRKTDLYIIKNKVNGAELGLIHWHGGLRKYVFRPFDNIVFDTDCLTAIAEFLNNLMVERKI